MVAISNYLDLMATDQAPLSQGKYSGKQLNLETYLPQKGNCSGYAMSRNSFALA